MTSTAFDDQHAPEPTPAEEEAWRELEQRQSDVKDSLTPNQERAEFEAWANGRCELHLVNPAGRYSSAITQFAWEAYQAGRAALLAERDVKDAEIATLRHALRKSAAVLSGLEMNKSALVHALELARAALAQEQGGSDVTP